MADDQIVAVGGGPAGLTVSHELSEAGPSHVVLKTAATRRKLAPRRGSVSLVTPNWTLRLPGFHHAGDDPITEDGSTVAPDSTSFGVHFLRARVSRGKVPRDHPRRRVDPNRRGQDHRAGQEGGALKSTDGAVARIPTGLIQSDVRVGTRSDRRR